MTEQLSPRVLAARRNGALGGLKRAQNNSKEKLKEWSSRGGQATQEIYGSDHKKHMVDLRKTVGRYKTPVEETKLGLRLAKRKKAA